MKGLKKSKLALTLVALVMLAAAVAVPLSDTIVHSASASGAIYPANMEYDGRDLKYGQYQTSSLTNPNIGGVDIILNWNDVEPQQGVFNWAPADKEMADWGQQGKKFALIVRYVHEMKQSSCTPSNQWLPAWEQARIPTLCSTGEIVPDYFDPTFQSDLTAYVQAIGQHMAASPYLNNLEYIRIGVGFAGEGYPCLGCNSTAMQTLTSWGYTINAWANWQKMMLTNFQNALRPSTQAPLIYPLGDNDKDPTTNQSVAQEVGYWAAANGMGVGQQGLQNSTGYANGAAVKIAQYVRKNYPSAYIQFQTVSTVSSASDLQGDINIASSAGAFSVEWYGTDTINPAYQPYFQQWQQMIDCRYGGNNCPTPSTTVSPSPSVAPSPSVSPSPSPSPSPSATASPSPGPGTPLAQDTFQRANQSHWGTASDTQNWGADANTLSNFSITQNTGQVVGSGKNATGYNAVLGPGATNAEVQFSGSISSFGGNTLGAVLRWTDRNDFYKAYITGTTLVIQKKVKGSVTTLKSTSFTAKPGTSYTLRFSVAGAILSASVWPTGTPPPASWMLSTTDSSLSSGYCGLLAYLASGIIADVSSFQALQQ